MNLNSGLSLIVLSIISLSLFAAPSFGEQELVTFSDNPKVHEVTSLEHLSDGSKAILAMYSLQTGGGCDTHDEAGLVCALTKSLGLGAQCSEKHLKLVHSWFKNGFPAMSIYQKSTIERSAKSGKLETICYNSPDTSTVQENWEIIRIKEKDNIVFVDAIRNWTFQSADGPYYRIEYKSKYHIIGKTISVVSHKEIPLASQ